MDMVSAGRAQITAGLKITFAATKSFWLTAVKDRYQELRAAHLPTKIFVLADCTVPG
jgi:hypothetical protein